MARRGSATGRPGGESPGPLGAAEASCYLAKPVAGEDLDWRDWRQRRTAVLTTEDKSSSVPASRSWTRSTPDFRGFSYGFRPKRSPHLAFDAMTVGIMTKKVKWVLDADIRSFFDTLKHEWLVRFIEHRAADRRVARLIQKWLNAGVLEEGQRIVSEVGTVQGGSIRPLLANLYLHYAFDLWAPRWRQRQAHGDVVVVRLADDFVVGFEHHDDAEQFLADLRQRFARFGLTLHPAERGSSNSVATRRRIGERAAWVNSRASSSWDSRTAGRPLGRAASRFRL